MGKLEKNSWTYVLKFLPNIDLMTNLSKSSIFRMALTNCIIDIVFPKVPFGNNNT